MRWYTELASNNPDLVKFVPSIGKSTEGRNQPAVHITAAETSEYRVFFQCQIHARELRHQVFWCQSIAICSLENPSISVPS